MQRTAEFHQPFRQANCIDSKPTLNNQTFRFIWQAALTSPPEAFEVPLAGPWMRCVKPHVAARARTCERWLPLWHVVIANQVELAALKDRLDEERLATLERLKVIYGPELSTLSDSEHQKTLIALETLVDIEFWARMRECHGLSAEAARAVWAAAIDRMLPPNADAVLMFGPRD